MNKCEALANFSSVKAAADEIGCTPEAVRMWPDPLPPRIRDRVQAALWRRHCANAAKSEGEGDRHAASLGVKPAPVHPNGAGVLV